MSNEITLLLSQQGTGSFVSNKQPGAGYHQKYDSLHTFVISFSNWGGVLKIQGTLELFPGDDSWVDLVDSSGQTMSYGGDTGEYNSTITVNARGNFIWIRAIGITNSGIIQQIQFSC